MSVNEEIEDDDFEALLADKRHRELSGTLKNIASSLSKEGDGKIIAAIDKQTKAIEGFVSAMSKLERQEQKEVKVEFNEKEIVLSVTEIGKSILKGLDELKEAINKKERKHKPENQGSCS